MAKYKRNSGKPWTYPEQVKLQVLATGNTPTRVIGLKLGRSPAAVYAQAQKQGVSLRPPNQKPYNRRKGR